LNLTKRLFLSHLAIVLALLALLLAARALAPTAGPELPSTAKDLPANLLSGTVTGLDPGDSIRLQLEQQAEGGVEGRGLLSAWPPAGEIREAADGQEALPLVDKRQPDVVPLARS